MSSWTELARMAAYKDLFNAEDSPVVQEARRCRKVLEGREVTDLHEIGLARGFLRLMHTISPGRLEEMTREDPPAKDPLQNPEEHQYPSMTRSR